MHEGKRLPRQHNTREEKGLYFASLGWGGLGWVWLRWDAMGWNGSGRVVFMAGLNCVMTGMYSDSSVLCRDVVWHDGGV